MNDLKGERLRMALGKLWCSIPLVMAAYGSVPAFLEEAIAEVDEAIEERLAQLEVETRHE